MNADTNYFENLWQQIRIWNSELSDDSFEKALIIKKLREQLSECNPVVRLKPLAAAKDILAKSCRNKISELDHILENANKIVPRLKSVREYKQEVDKMDTCDELGSNDNEKLSNLTKRFLRDQSSNEVQQLPYCLRQSSRKGKATSTKNISANSTKIVHKNYRTKRQYIYCCEEDAVCNREAHHSLHIEIPRLFLQGQRHQLYLSNKLCEETFSDLAMEAKQRSLQECLVESTNRKKRRRDTQSSSIISNQPAVEEAEIAHLVRNIIPGDKSDDEETWKAARVLECINNNSADNCESHIAVSPTTFEPLSSKGRSSSAHSVNRGQPAKQGRKPKKKIAPLPQPQRKTTLAEYVENFGSDFDVAGTVIPTASASSTIPVVSSTSQHLNERDPGPIMCYIAGDWTNGGPIQLVGADGLSINATQIEQDPTNYTTLPIQHNELNANFGQPIVSLPLSSFDMSTLIQPRAATEVDELENVNTPYSVTDIQNPNMPVELTAVTSLCKSNEMQQQPYPAHIHPLSRSPIHYSFKNDKLQQQPVPAHTRTQSSPIRVLDLSIKSKAYDALHISTDTINTNDDELANDTYGTMPLDLSAAAAAPKLGNANTITTNELDTDLCQSQDCREDNNDTYNDFVRCLDELNFDRYTNKPYKGRDMPLLNLNSGAEDVFIGDAAKSLPIDTNYVPMNEERANLQSSTSSNHYVKDFFTSLLDIGSFTAVTDNNNQDNLTFFDLDYEKFEYAETTTFKSPDVNGDLSGDQKNANDQSQVEKCSMALNRENCEQLQPYLDDSTKTNKSPGNTCAGSSLALAENTCVMPDDAKKSLNASEQGNYKNEDYDENDSHKISKINLLSKIGHAVETDSTTSSNDFNIIQYIEENNLCNILNNSKLVGTSTEAIVSHRNIATPRIELAKNQQIADNCESKCLNLNQSNSDKDPKKCNILNGKRCENSRRQSLKACISLKRLKHAKKIGRKRKRINQNYKKDKSLTIEKKEPECNKTDVKCVNDVQLQNVKSPHPPPSSSKIVFSVKQVEPCDGTTNLDTACDSCEKKKKTKTKAEISNIQDNLNHIEAQLDNDTLQILQNQPAVNSSYRELPHGYPPKKDEMQAVLASLNLSNKPEIIQECELKKDDANKYQISATQDSETGFGFSCRNSENISNTKMEETMNLSAQENRQSIKDLTTLTNSIEENIQNGKKQNESISQSAAVNTSQNSCESMSKMSLWHIESKLDEDNLDFEADFDDTLSITASDICYSPVDNFTESLDCNTNDVDVLPPAENVTTEFNDDNLTPACSVPTNSKVATKSAAEATLEDLKHFKIPKLIKKSSETSNNKKIDTTKIYKLYEDIADINHFTLQPYVRLNRLTVNKDDNFNVTEVLTNNSHNIFKKNVEFTYKIKEMTSITENSKEKNNNNAVKTEDDNLSLKTKILKSDPKMAQTVKYAIDSNVSDIVKHYNSATRADGNKLCVNPQIAKSKSETSQNVKIKSDNIPPKLQMHESEPKMIDKVKHHNYNSKITDGDILNLKPPTESEPKAAQSNKVLYKVNHQPSGTYRSNDKNIFIQNIFGITCLPYLVDCCNKPHCQFSHELKDSETVYRLLKISSNIHLMEAYSFMYNHEKLFASFFITFCKFYTLRLDRYKLLSMAIDCERYPQHSHFLDDVYEGLVKCGLSRANACNHILQTAKQKSPIFIDALVAIIIKSDWTVFVDNIDRIADNHNFRLGQLEKMFKSVLRNNNQHLKMVFWKCLLMLHKDDVYSLPFRTNNVLEWVKTLQNSYSL